ncbi:hypothetical protein PA05_0127 [Cutibacterium acnes P05]|nr:hypothetical protein [Cutibacterium acnes P05]
MNKPRLRSPKPGKTLKRPPKPSASSPVCRTSAALVVNGPNTRG